MMPVGTSDEISNLWVRAQIGPVMAEITQAEQSAIIRFLWCNLELPGSEFPIEACRPRAVPSFYSSRKVFAGSIAAIRKAGNVVAITVTSTMVKTTMRIVEMSYTSIP
jgi:hypothetical protein